MSTTSLPISDPNAPWHPDTLWDIRNVNLSDLPHVNSLSPHERDRHFPYSGVLCGMDEDIKEKMEGAFLHFPDISFMRHNDGVVMFGLKS
jgi:hypothetical protein